MSDAIDEADDRPGSPGAPGVPPAPSVTPGSAPPPPSGVEPRSWSRRGCLIAGAVVAAVGLLLLVGVVAVLVLAKGWLGNKVDDLARDRQEIVDETGIETGSTDTVHPPQRDIRLGACEYDAAGGVQASGTLTNWTGDPSSYWISLSFREGNGGQGSEFGSTVVTVEDVGAHATTNWSASVPVRPEDGSYTCRVVRIDRWTSGQDPPSEPGS